MCTQAIPPRLASPIPRGVRLRKQAAFWGKGRSLEWDAEENRLFSGLLVRHLSTEFELQSLITRIYAVSSTHAKIERLDANARELL